jgi:hypothetical protein
LKYYNLKLTKRSDKLILGELKKRRTTQWYSLSNEIDFKKTKRATPANFIHLLDGFMIRALTKNFGVPVITIHDSIGVPIFQIEEFKEQVKLVAQNFFDENILNLKRESKNILKVRSSFIYL